jgi:FAD-linked oxidoreductase
MRQEPTEPERPGWANWSGSVTARPVEIAHPASEDELAAIVRRAPQLRVAGAGHSFWPLCETDGVLVVLDALPGGLEVAADRTRAWAPAGWTIDRLTRALWDEGLSLANQGDIDRQALAGALATGTHGTGRDLPCLSAGAHRYRLMLADGSVVTCGGGEREELYQAQRLSLGLLGVALAVEIAVVPAYHLEERIEKRPLAEVLDGFADLAAGLRHVEAFIWPHADTAILKTLHPAEDDGTFVEPGPVDETVFRLCCELSAASSRFTAPLQQLMARGSGRSRRVGPAHRIFPSERTVRFEEMEHEVPREAAIPLVRATIDWIRREHLPVAFPFELRWVAADDIWLSPFNAGPCASLSLHQFAPMPWRDLFTDAEAKFRAAGGRPHWAKRHTLSRDDVDALYPMAERFRSVRRAHDPGGRFLNEPLGALFS